MFIEIGSNEERWRREDAGLAVAKAALAAVRAETSGSAAIGLGGTHYCPKFTQLALRRSQPFGHILPKYALEAVNGAFLKYAIERTLEPVDRVVFDWKGMSGNDKERLVPEVEKLGLRLERA
jgi:D-aminoacyl-tRNA deacylase